MIIHRKGKTKGIATMHSEIVQQICLISRSWRWGQGTGHVSLPPLLQRELHDRQRHDE